MSMFDSITDFFSGGQQGGYEDMEKRLREGMDEYRKNTGQANALMDPYYQAGKGEMNPYMDNYKRMLDPNKFTEDMMKGYETSPGAQRQLKMGADSAMNAASASGMLGSSNLLNQVNEESQGIMKADQNNYLDRQLGIYNNGLGQQQGMVNMGYGAGQQMGNNYMQQGNAMMRGYGDVGNAQLGQNMGRMQGWANLFGTAGKMFGNLGMG